MNVLPEINTLPDLNDHPEVLYACQCIADLVGEVTNSPVTFLMNCTAELHTVKVSSKHPMNPAKAGDTLPMGCGIYCEYILENGTSLHVPDALNDPVWAKNPDATDFGLLSYYGVPVSWPTGEIFGTFCIFDHKARERTQKDQQIVEKFGRVIETLLDQMVTKEHLTHLADHDDLTGLLNRSALLKKLKTELYRVNRYNSPLALIYLDLDHFKELNDTYGHLAGDLALQQFAELLKDHSRIPDLIGRMGGEEFIICAPETTLDEAHQLAERIIKTTKETALKIGETSLEISASAGVVTAISGSQELDDLIGRADKAMYRAKQQGRNCCVCIP